MTNTISNERLAEIRYVAQVLIDRANPMNSDRKNELLMDSTDLELVGRLIKMTQEEFMSIPYRLRFALCFITLEERVKADGQRFEICRDILGSYTVKAHCLHKGQLIHYATESIYDFRDCEVLIKYITKPHYKVLDGILSRMNYIAATTDEDRAMQELNK